MSKCLDIINELPNIYLSSFFYLFLHSPMVWETWVQSLVASYQRLLKWYLIPPCLTLSNIRYVFRVKWSNPGKGVAPSPTPWCCSYWKGSLQVTLDSSRQFYLNTFCQIQFTSHKKIYEYTDAIRKGLNHYSDNSIPKTKKGLFISWLLFV